MTAKTMEMSSSSSSTTMTMRIQCVSPITFSTVYVVSNVVVFFSLRAFLSPQQSRHTIFGQSEGEKKEFGAAHTDTHPLTRTHIQTHCSLCEKNKRQSAISLCLQSYISRSHCICDSYIDPTCLYLYILCI